MVADLWVVAELELRKVRSGDRQAGRPGERGNLTGNRRRDATDLNVVKPLQQVPVNGVAKQRGAERQRLVVSAAQQGRQHGVALTDLPHIELQSRVRARERHRRGVTRTDEGDPRLMNTAQHRPYARPKLIEVHRRIPVGIETRSSSARELEEFHHRLAVSLIDRVPSVPVLDVSPGRAGLDPLGRGPRLRRDVRLPDGQEHRARDSVVPGLGESES